MKRVFLIMSGAYCTPDVMAEFGRIPACFVPLAGKRLFEHQMAFAEKLEAQIFVTLPDDFTVSSSDQAVIQRFNANVIKSKARESLIEAIRKALDLIADADELFLLHGDTLVELTTPEMTDQIATAGSAEFYEWADIILEPDGSNKIAYLAVGLGDGRTERNIACGYFTFSRIDILREAMEVSNDFVGGLCLYAHRVPMCARPVSRWHDFGHLPLIYASRCDALVSRAFNSIQSDGRSVLKHSTQTEKILAEAYWFENLPFNLRPFVPQFMGVAEFDNEVSYRLEYMFLPTLAELSVFGCLPEYVWRRILTHVCEFLSICRNHRPPPGHALRDQDQCDALFQQLFGHKSRQRFADFLSSRGWEMSATVLLNGQETAPLFDIVEQMIASIRPTQPEDITIVHGDLFFGNILYDFRGRRVVALDPRGMYGSDKPSLYADTRYDVAKLAHSILGGYDKLLVGRGGFEQAGDREFTLNHDSILSPGVLDDFLSRQIGGKLIFNRDIAAMTSLLFFSMLPLHAEDAHRQNAFLSMAILMSRLANDMAPGGGKK